MYRLACLGLTALIAAPGVAYAQPFPIEPTEETLLQLLRAGAQPAGVARVAPEAGWLLGSTLRESALLPACGVACLDPALQLSSTLSDASAVALQSAAPKAVGSDVFARGIRDYEAALELASPQRLQEALRALPPEDRIRALGAWRVLAQNLRWADIEGRRYPYFVPQSDLYDADWLWDEGWTLRALAAVNPGMALDVMDFELLSQVTEGAYAGQLPHMRYIDVEAHQPGPELWVADTPALRELRARDPQAELALRKQIAAAQPLPASRITQPPNLAGVLVRILDNGGDAQRVANMLPRIEAFHDYLLRDLDPQGWGIVGVPSSWTPGTDNLNVYDAPKAQQSANGGPLRLNVPGETFEERGPGHPTQQEWDQYFRNADLIVREDLPPAQRYAEFFVYDPYFNVRFINDLLDLANAAERVGAADIAERAYARARDVREALSEHLWREDLGHYGYYDLARPGGGGFIPPAEGGETFGSYTPAFLPYGWEDASRRTRMLDVVNSARFRTEHGLTTMPTDFEGAEPLAMWRGSIWAPPEYEYLQYLLSIPVAERTPQITRDIERSRAMLSHMLDDGAFEYRHPFTHEGRNEGFLWPAALFLDGARQVERAP